jgi:hypothetical protein
VISDINNTFWGERNAYSVLVWKPERKLTTCNTRFTREDVIKMDLEETGWEGVEWMCLIRYGNTLRDLVNTVVNLWVLRNAGRFLTS